MLLRFFHISKNIDDVLDENQVKEYVSGVAGAIEIIDSRYKNFKFSIEDYPPNPLLLETIMWIN